MKRRTHASGAAHRHQKDSGRLTDLPVGGMTVRSSWAATGWKTSTGATLHGAASLEGKLNRPRAVDTASGVQACGREVDMGQVTTALVSGVVALLVAGGSAVLTLAQIRGERRKWLADIKATWSLELYKARMATYPEVHQALAPLSHVSIDPITPEVAGNVAIKLNGWIYSAGGLCADATTRGAVLRLRECCREWAESGGAMPANLYEWRNLTTTFLRRDLDVLGLDSYDFGQDSTLLAKLEQELGSVSDRKGG